jgi:hypothetical protein
MDFIWNHYIFSFLAPPTTLNPNSTWKNYEFADILKQKAVFSDILQVKWQTFRTEGQIKARLENVGFKIMDVIYDTQGMFLKLLRRNKVSTSKLSYLE